VHLISVATYNPRRSTSPHNDNTQLEFVSIISPVCTTTNKRVPGTWNHCSAIEQMPALVVPHSNLNFLDQEHRYTPGVLPLGAIVFGILKLGLYLADYESVISQPRKEIRQRECPMSNHTLGGLLLCGELKL
jgi:hypothetical protein